MAMGSQPGGRQESLWIETTSLPKTSGHPFYEKLNALLSTHGFDAMAERASASFYADGVGRPSTPPGVYFRMIFIGFFEGIDSERGIAWRTADSMALRSFLGYSLSETTPDHSNLSRTRHRIDLETHQAVFDWVLGVLAKEGLLKGRTLGIDARWRPTPRCAASFGATAARVTMSSSTAWSRPQVSTPRPVRTAARSTRTARAKARIRTGRARTTRMRALRR